MHTTEIDPRSAGSSATANRRVRPLLRVGMALAVAALAGSLTVSAAVGDPLDDKHKELQQQISQTQQDMSESSQAASDAAVALTTAEHELSAAQAALAKTQQEVQLAADRDAAMAAKLRQQRAELAEAKAAVAKGLKDLAAKKALVGEIVRNQFQKQTSLMPLAMLTTSTSASDMEKRLQLSHTMLDTNQSEFNDLTALQKKLDAEKAKQAALEKQVAADRAEAAATLQTKRNLEAQAETQKANVASLVKQRESAQAAADRAAAADKAHYQNLESEDASVQKRIAERIAREKAEAARRAAAARAKAAAEARARAARERAAKAKSAADAAAARAEQRAAEKQAKANSGGGGSSDGSGSSGGGSNSSAHHGFIYPAAAPITSPYGMRLHPILHVWKLHDGTDFGAACGAPIYAPYSGKVVERYFNAGYGNRLIIDHGKVDGHYITTAMNHAVSYNVGVGAHVSKGQVIGHVGQTGYATGCHMHLMVWKDGNMINPMSWY